MLGHIYFDIVSVDQHYESVVDRPVQIFYYLRLLQWRIGYYSMAVADAGLNDIGYHWFELAPRLIMQMGKTMHELDVGLKRNNFKGFKLRWF